MHGKGREAITQAHDAILRTFYAGSVLEYAVKSVRMLAEDVALLHINAQLRVPQGPLAGQLQALPSMVVARQGDSWKIASFHNTFVTAPPPMHNNGQGGISRSGVTVAASRTSTLQPDQVTIGLCVA